jgi:sec-independent protein translocase protein TatA
MGPSWWQILIVLVLFVLLFGRGKISDLMGDVAKGIKSFKAGMSDDEPRAEPAQTEPKVIEHGSSQAATKPSPRAKTTSRAKPPRSRKSG